MLLALLIAYHIVGIFDLRTHHTQRCSQIHNPIGRSSFFWPPRLEIRGTAKGQRRLIDLKPGEIRSVKLEIIYNQDRSQVTDSDQK